MPSFVRVADPADALTRNYFFMHIRQVMVPVLQQSIHRHGNPSKVPWLRGLHLSLYGGVQRTPRKGPKPTTKQCSLAECNVLVVDTDQHVCIDGCACARWWRRRGSRPRQRSCCTAPAIRTPTQSLTWCWGPCWAAAASARWGGGERKGVGRGSEGRGGEGRGWQISPHNHAWPRAHRKCLQCIRAAF